MNINLFIPFTSFQSTNICRLVKKTSWSDVLLSLLSTVDTVARMVRDGYFGYKDYFKSLCDTVEGGKDFYLLGYDFASYLEAQVTVFIIHILLFFPSSFELVLKLIYSSWIYLQAAADKAFVDQEKWTRMSILNTAGSARFSSDRTIEEYAEDTWRIEPCKCPL